MKTSAKETSLAHRMVNSMSEYSTEEVLAGVLKVNGSGLTEHNVDAIRICFLVKKLLSKRRLDEIPESASKIPGSEINNSVFEVNRLV